MCAHSPNIQRYSRKPIAQIDAILRTYRWRPAGSYDRELTKGKPDGRTRELPETPPHIDAITPVC